MHKITRTALVAGAFFMLAAAGPSFAAEVAALRVMLHPYAAAPGA